MWEQVFSGLLTLIQVIGVPLSPISNVSLNLLFLLDALPWIWQAALNK